MLTLVVNLQNLLRTGQWPYQERELENPPIRLQSKHHGKICGDRVFFSFDQKGTQKGVALSNVNLLSEEHLPRA